MEDGRKSFRAISREIKVSAPTVKARYERLVNIGLIRSVRPEIDISRISRRSKKEYGKQLENLRRQGKHFHLKVQGLSVRLKCEFCGGPIHDRPKVLKFAGFERFFCCSQCKVSYKDKYGGRIEMLEEQYRKT
jgi:Lrp/AsnC family leucine-responsive transcriptional regulator